MKIIAILIILSNMSTFIVSILSSPIDFWLPTIPYFKMFYHFIMTFSIVNNAIMNIF